MGSDLYNTLQEDFKAKLKNKDSLGLSVLRLLLAEIKNRQIDKGEVLNGAEIQAVIKKAVKERHDAIDQYTKAGRTDLADQEQAELVILEGYLPAQMSKEEITAIVDELLATTPVDKSEKGRVFGMVMRDVLGKIASEGKSADGGLVSSIIKEKLQ